jgi:hypothetical protein
MPKGRHYLPDNKKEEKGRLTKVKALTPLLSLIIRILELMLRVLRIIN